MPWENASNQVALLAVASDGKVTFVYAVSDDLTHTLMRDNCQEMAQITGGGGGGRKNRAELEANPSKMRAIERMKEIIRQVSCPVRTHVMRLILRK